MKNIPAGYQVTIHSSENDGDLSTSNSLYGLSKNDAIFLQQVTKELKNHGDNDFVDLRDVYKAVETALGCVDASDHMVNQLVRWQPEYSDEYVQTRLEDFLRRLCLIGLDEGTYDSDSLYIRCIDKLEFFYLEYPAIDVNHEFQ